jgi:putative pyoverdin transport system ATP-binding/permease protein
VRLRSFLIRSGGRGIAVVAVMGILSGLASSAFVAVVNAALHARSGYLLALGFALIALVRVGTNVLSQWYVIKFAQKSILELSEGLARRVIETPFRTLESIGPSRIMTTLTDDVGTLATALTSVPLIVTNGAILLGCTFYLAWLSGTAALVLMAFGAVGGVGYKLFTRNASAHIVEARLERDTMFRLFRSLTEGIKEIKMNRARSARFIDKDFADSVQRLRRLNLAAMRRYLLADAWAQCMFFLIMGVMVFALPRLQPIPVAALTGYAFVALYAMTPIWGFIGALPAFQRGEAALARIEEVGLSLTSGSTDISPDDHRAIAGAAIEMHQITFSYPATNGSTGFTLGPIDVSVRPGELLFIIGGNGSGKSTFVKLLTGLYAPDAGEIRLNGEPVTVDKRARYREQFSAVFSDFYLFDNLAGIGGEDVDAMAASYLQLLGLQDKVSVKNGVLSTTQLSQGQRRRLALLTAYLENRPVYVFDEWAADQDPAYREIFYARFLPELKARGKTVVVITHDDRYFSLGDRVIKLEYGQVSSDDHQLGPSGPAEPLRQLAPNPL